MFCFFDTLQGENGTGINRLSAEDYARFLKSVQRMNSLNLSGVFQEVTPSEMSLIYAAEEYAQKNGGALISVAEAASKLQVSVPAVSRTLNSLEGKQLIERRCDERDRRSVKLFVTEKGRRVHDENARLFVTLINKVLAHFSDEELGAMVDLHCKLTQAFSDEFAKLKQA